MGDVFRVGLPLTLVPAITQLGALIEGAFCVMGCLSEPSGEWGQQKLRQTERRAVTQTVPIHTVVAPA